MRKMHEDAIRVLGEARYVDIVTGVRPVIWSLRLSGKTLAEVASELGISPERVRQIEAKIYRDLRDAIKEQA